MGQAGKWKQLQAKEIQESRSVWNMFLHVTYIIQ